MPQQEGFELTPEQKNLVMHVGLELPDGQMLMASDIGRGHGTSASGGKQHLHLHPPGEPAGSRPHVQRAGQGGTITMPIADQFWGDYFGSLTDRFGINWMVNYSAQATA